MSGRHIELSKEQAALLQALVSSGAYDSEEAALSAGVERLQADYERFRAAAGAAWDRGDAASEAGDYLEGSPAELVAELKQRVERV